MTLENFRKRLKTVMHKPLPTVQIHPLVFDLFESVYFAAAVAIFSIGIKGSLKDFTALAYIERIPWVTGLEDTIANLGFQFYFWSTFLLFFRFLIQRRWPELSSPVMFWASAMTRFTASILPSRYLSDLVIAITLLLLNSVLLLKTIHRILSRLSPQARD